MIRSSNSVSTSRARQSHQKSFFGNYLGIVIQNNDPDHRGRIKIFVPHITPSIYENWDATLKDKQFKFIGDNIDSDLTGIIDEAKQILPWAECAAPLMGATGSGRYNAYERKATISDSSQNTSSTPVPGGRARQRPDEADQASLDALLNSPGAASLGGAVELDAAGIDDLDALLHTNTLSQSASNFDGVGEKPAHLYEMEEYKVHDGFSTTTRSDNTTNQGMPNKINKYSYTYTPNSYSNQAKGSFSIPNVGSHVWVFFEGGNPMSPVYFAVSHGREDWNAIYESSNEHGIDYPGTYENKSLGDDNVYNHNTETYRNKFVFNQKGGTLEFVNTDNREILKMTHFSGSFKEFNNHTTSEFAVNNDQKLVQGDQFLTIKGDRNEITELDYDMIVRGDYYSKVGTFNHEAYSEWREMVGEFANIKQLFEIKRTGYEKSDYFQQQSPGQLKAGTPAPCPLCSDVNRPLYWDVNNRALPVIPPMFATKIPMSIMNFIGILKKVLKPNFDFKRPPIDPKNFLGSGACPVCNGTGLSPSSQDGIWQDQQKDKVISAKLKRLISDLSKVEQKMGLGGSHISHISKHKVETIGLLFNDFPSVRVDPVGKVVNSEVKVFREGVVTVPKESPLVEYVHVDDLPGGTYTLTANNRFNCTVGAGGISMKSYGPVDIGGTITNVGGQQINLAAEHEINITAGGRVNIVADILSLRQKNYKQVLVESNLGVSQNLVVGGSLHVEGEITAQHITGPMEMHETEQTGPFGEPVPGMLIGYAILSCPKCPGAWPVYGVPTPMSIQTYQHSHMHKGLPSSMTQSSDDVRQMGANTSGTFKSPPTPKQDTPKGGGLFGIGDSLGLG